MNVILLDIELYGFTVILFTEYPDTGSNLLSQFAFQHSEAIFRDPDDMMLAMPYCMC